MKFKRGISFSRLQQVNYPKDGRVKKIMMAKVNQLVSNVFGYHLHMGMFYSLGKERYFIK